MSGIRGRYNLASQDLFMNYKQSILDNVNRTVLSNDPNPVVIDCSLGRYECKRENKFVLDIERLVTS